MGDHVGDVVVYGEPKRRIPRSGRIIARRRGTPLVCAEDVLRVPLSTFSTRTKPPKAAGIPRRTNPGGR